jgi:8-oxo-dGTP diphosphatase
MKIIADRYNGITIDPLTLPETLQEFEKELLQILNDHTEKNLLWIKLPIDKSNFIPLLTNYDFVFHHADETELMLVKRLIEDPILPTAKNHTLGVGAVVLDGDKILVIKDRFYDHYKLPGGHIDDRENISDALAREVYEETGVKVAMHSIVAISHFSPAQFGESNVYILCKAEPLTKEIGIIDVREIVDARWMQVDAFLEQAHEYARTMVQAVIEGDVKEFMLSEKNFFSIRDVNYELFF